MSEVLDALEAARAAIRGDAPAAPLDAATPEADTTSAESAPEPQSRRRPAHLAPAARYSRAQAARANALVLAAPIATGALGDLSFALAPTRPTAQPLPAEAPTSRAFLALGGVRLALELGLGATSALARMAGAYDAVTLLGDPPLAALALEAVAAPLLERIEKAAGVRITVEDWRACAGEDYAAQADRLEWVVSGLPDGPERAGLVGGGQVLSLALEHFGAAAEAAARGAAEAETALSLPAALRLPNTRLTLGALSSLEPGDVVLDGFSRADLRLCVCHRRWRVGLEEDANVTVADASETEDLTAPDVSLGETGASEAETALADAELTVSFELARTSLPLSTVRRLAPGYVFTLDRAVSGEVDIMVSNRRFGRGRLVEVDGEIGIEVVRVG